MRIAIFTDTFLPQVSGVTNTLKRLGDYLESEQMDYIFITPDQKSDSDIPYNMEKFFSAPLAFYPECRITVLNWARMCKRIDAFSPDLIFLMTEFSVGLSGLRYGKKKGIPVVSNYSTNFATILGSYKLSPLIKPLNKYLSWFHNEADLTVTPSRESEKVLQALEVARTAIFTRGIDFHRFSPLKRSSKLREDLKIGDRILLLYVGRLSPEKDLDVLRDAMCLLNQGFEDRISLMITGDGPMKDELVQTMPENVIFTGYKKGESLAEIYASADIFAFPSSFETFGNVVLEAMASGVPAVGVGQGGVVNIIDHGKTGYLAEPKNPESFAAYLSKLIVNDVERKSFASQGRAYAASKSWKSVFDDLMGLFGDVSDCQRPEGAAHIV